MFDPKEQVFYKNKLFYVYEWYCFLSGSSRKHNIEYFEKRNIFTVYDFTQKYNDTRSVFLTSTLNLTEELIRVNKKDIKFCNPKIKTIRFYAN